ncbi:hypothetical protein [Actinoplanes sp. RD1]|uniref:hypothetical protein n=1 Tax=Actinoplanes sp. RD1 TaxID=3064538 RepID=UPI0027417D26|nr:hypothetical protein [Actinoplanes sp. RD1]
MLYDDDQSGPSYSPLDNNDDRYANTPEVDPELLAPFGNIDRILIVLAIARRAHDISGSFKADQVLGNAHLRADEPSGESALAELRGTGEIKVKRYGDDYYLAITEQGVKHVDTVTDGRLREDRSAERPDSGFERGF